MSAFGTAPASLDSPIVSRRIDSPHQLLDLLLRQSGTILFALTLSNAVSTVGAQPPAVSDSLQSELNALRYEPIDFEQIEYEQLALPLPIESLAMPSQELQTRALQPAPVGPSPAAAHRMPRQLTAAACDAPGSVAPLPCQPLTQAPPLAETPPKRQVHHVYVQPPAAHPLAQQPRYSSPAQQPPGAFVAPPQAGTVVQEQRSLGLRGMRITFPALTFELPSIELPHWIRRGRAAHMELAGGTAPYVAAAGVAQHGVSRVSLASPQAAPPRPAAAPPQQQHAPPTPPAADPSSLQQDFEKLQRRCQRLEELLEKMIQCQPPSADMHLPPPACPPTPHHLLRPQPECLPVPHR